MSNSLSSAIAQLQAENQKLIEERDEAVAAARTMSARADNDAEEIVRLEAEGDALREALEMLYEKYEDGDPCTENGDEQGEYLGNCVRLSAEEENQILNLIPPERSQANEAIGKPQGKA